jgi:hypothetical protein
MVATNSTNIQTYKAARVIKAMHLKARHTCMTCRAILSIQQRVDCGRQTSNCGVLNRLLQHVQCFSDKDTHKNKQSFVRQNNAFVET